MTATQTRDNSALMVLDEPVGGDRLRSCSTYDAVRAELLATEEIKQLLEFIEKTERGVIR